MYKSTTDFCVLILYPASLLNLFVRAHSLCVVSSGFSTCSIISSMNRDNFYFFLSDGDAHYFIQLSNCPGSTLWNNAEVKWQGWAFLSSSRSWRESMWRVTIKYNVSDVALKMPFTSSRSSLPFQLFLVLFFFFYHGRVLRFIKLSLRLLRWPRVLCPSLYWDGAFHWLIFRC